MVMRVSLMKRLWVFSAVPVLLSALALAEDEVMIDVQQMPLQDIALELTRQASGIFQNMSDVPTAQLLSEQYVDVYSRALDRAAVVGKENAKAGCAAMVESMRDGELAPYIAGDKAAGMQSAMQALALAQGYSTRLVPACWEH